MKRSVLTSLLALLMLGVAGCAPMDKKAQGYAHASDNPFIAANYTAADVLLTQLQGHMPPQRSTLIIATLVNIDALDRSSTLGRLVSEQVSARFTQTGFRMVEMKFRNNVYMAQGQGELMLTREIHELAKAHAAQAVIVGTYGESKDHIYINLKVIQPSSNVIVAVHDYALPINENTRAMLRTKRF